MQLVRQKLLNTPATEVETAVAELGSGCHCRMQQAPSCAHGVAALNRPMLSRSGLHSPVSPCLHRERALDCHQMRSAVILSCMIPRVVLSTFERCDQATQPSVRLHNSRHARAVVVVVQGSMH